MKKNSTYHFQLNYIRAISFLLLTVFVFIGLSNQKSGLKIGSAKLTVEKHKQASEDLVLFEEDELDERTEDVIDSDFELLPAVLTNLFQYNIQLIQFNWTSVNIDLFQSFFPSEIYLNIRNLRI